MRAKVAFVALVLLFALAPLPTALADQVVNIGFEGFGMTHFSSGASVENTGTTWVKVASFSVSFSSEKYLTGITVKWTSKNIDGGDGVTSTGYYKIKVVVGSSEQVSALYSHGEGTVSHLNPFAFTGLHGDAFTVDVYAQAYGSGDDDTYTVVVNDVYIYSMNEDYGVKSKLTELKYVPPGADGSSSALVINHTEVLLGQTYNLSQGTVAFWLKWDGTTNIKLSDNIGIDSSGYIYIKNTDGTTYTLDGINPPAGIYVPVYVGWSSSGEGYIMINTTKVMLNWAGNVILSKVGELNNESTTLIDEFKLWDTYIPPDQIILESLSDQYSLIYNGNIIAITPEGGQNLGIIDVAFLDSNLTTINSTTLSNAQKTATVPNGTVMVILSKSGVSRRYHLANYTKIAFPADEATLISSTITIRPTTWQYLTLKTPDGRIATRIKLDDTQTATVLTVVGNDYIITLENGNITKSMLYTITGDISLWVESEAAKYSGRYVDAQIDPDNNMLIVTYYDGTGSTNNLSITVSAYDENNLLKYVVEDSAPASPVMLYKFSLPVGNDSDVMYYKVLISADGKGYSKTVWGAGGGEGVFPSNVAPDSLIIFGAAVTGILIFVAINAYLMPLGALLALGAVKFMGLANVPNSLLGLVGVFAALSLIMYRKDQGVG